MNRNKTLVLAAAAAAVSATVWAASVPNTFTAGGKAVASEVNANFAALVSAVTSLESKVSTLETKVAALESVNTPLTADDVVGTYQLLALGAGTQSNNSTLEFGVEATKVDATVTFDKTSSTGGSFTFSGTDQQSGFTAKGTQCNSTGTFATSSSGPSSSGTAGTHFHTYSDNACTPGGFVSTQTDGGEINNGSGTWALGSNNTITITPGGPEPGPSFTAHVSKPGRLMFAVESENTGSTGVTGKLFSLDVLVKR